MNIHEWAAEQCGADIEELFPDKYIFWPDGKPGTGWIWWTIKDARCREIVREYFGIETHIVAHMEDKIMVFDLYVCFTFDGNRNHRGSGKTIAEAEINCIEAIRKARK